MVFLKQLMRYIKHICLFCRVVGCLLKIAWITPQGGQSNKPAGIGVQFIDDTSSYFCNKIETLLGEKRHFSEPTDTL